MSVKVYHEKTLSYEILHEIQVCQSKSRKENKIFPTRKTIRTFFFFCCSYQPKLLMASRVRIQMLKNLAKYSCQNWMLKDSK